jgi:hypothetical protein
MTIQADEGLAAWLAKLVAGQFGVSLNSQCGDVLA